MPQDNQQAIFAAANKFDFQRIYNKRQIISYTLPQAVTSTSSVQYDQAGGGSSFVTSTAAIPANGTILIAPYDLVLMEILVVWETANSGALTLDFEKLEDTDTPGSGNTVLDTTFDLTTAANTTNYGIITRTISDRNLLRGQRLAYELTGTVDNLDNVCVIVEFMYQNSNRRV